MQNWRILFNIFLILGAIVLLFGAFVFIDTYHTVSINPYLPGQVAFTTALDQASDYFLLSAVGFVSGVVIYYFEHSKEEDIANSSSEDMTEEDILDRIDRLEDVVDNNFTVITKRLDRIEERQTMLSENTLIKAKKA